MVLNIYSSAWATGWIIEDPYALTVAVPLILILSSLPVSPGAWGVQEGAYIYFLETLGGSSGQAAAVAFLIRAKLLLLAIAGAAVWLIKPPSSIQDIGERAAANTTTNSK